MRSNWYREGALVVPEVCVVKDIGEWRIIV